MTHSLILEWFFTFFFLINKNNNDVIDKLLIILKTFCSREKLSQKLKLLGNSEFNHTNMWDF